LAVFSKILNLKIHENPYSRSQVVPCRQIGEEEETETDRHIIMKLTAAFHNFVNVPKYKSKLSYPVEYYSDVSSIVRRFWRVAHLAY
jgi:hypothetical protein